MKVVQTLILVYNADSGSWSALVDSTKKLLRVEGCTLCAITHGLLAERPQWRECREELGVHVQAYHRDDVPPPLRALAGEELPCILAQSGADTVRLLDSAAMLQCKGSVEDVKARLYRQAAVNGWRFPTERTQGG